MIPPRIPQDTTPGYPRDTTGYHPGMRPGYHPRIPPQNIPKLPPQDTPRILPQHTPRIHPQDTHRIPPQDTPGYHKIQPPHSPGMPRQKTTVYIQDATGYLLLLLLPLAPRPLPPLPSPPRRPHPSCSSSPSASSVQFRFFVFCFSRFPNPSLTAASRTYISKWMWKFGRAHKNERGFVKPSASSSSLFLLPSPLPLATYPRCPSSSLQAKRRVGRRAAIQIPGSRFHSPRTTGLEQTAILRQSVTKSPPIAPRPLPLPPPLTSPSCLQSPLPPPLPSTHSAGSADGALYKYR